MTLIFGSPTHAHSSSTRYVTAKDGTLLAYRDFNHVHPGQSAIVLAHGAFSSGEVFYKQFDSEALSPFRIIAYDQRGFGFSQKPSSPGNYTSHEILADDLWSIIDQLKLEKPIISGWSAGAISTMDYLQKYGDSRISGVSLIDGLACASSACNEAATKSLTGVQAFNLLISTNETINFEGTTQYASALAYNNSISPRDSLRIGAISQQSPVFVMQARFQIPFINYKDTYANLTVPLLLQYGQDDTVLFYQDDVLLLEETVRLFTSISYANGGHISFILEPQAFNDDLSTWLKRLAV